MENARHWQERVVIEYRELGDRLAKLKLFKESPKFYELDQPECDRLLRQLDAMNDYWSILRERIAAFKK